MNVVTLFGVTLAELGRFREAKGDSVEIAGSASSDHYRKVVVDPKGVMVGAMYLGGPAGVAEMGVIHHAIKRRENWKDFVDPSGPAAASYAAMAVRTPEGFRPVAKG